MIIDFKHRTDRIYCLLIVAVMTLIGFGMGGLLGAVVFQGICVFGFSGVALIQREARLLDAEDAA
jgi:hypothetical protein